MPTTMILLLAKRMAQDVKEIERETHQLSMWVRPTQEAARLNVLIVIIPKRMMKKTVYDGAEHFVF
jgi:hypothetical protein